MYFFLQRNFGVDRIFKWIQSTLKCRGISLITKISKEATHHINNTIFCAGEE